ncbi:MAG TPA: GNAT family N-acetyltransferase [Candidatus Saccharimonas sp.]|nr:GNAT family N-acetyltransferase [Candidatus Saccharimonas sp.]
MADLIKPFDPTDRAARRQLGRLVFESQRYQRVTLDHIDTDTPQFAKTVQKIVRYNLADPHVQYYLYWQGARAIGHILLRQLPDTHEAHIDDLGVDPAVRRQGVARALLQFADDWAREHGCTTLKLSTQRANVAALAAYQAAGYSEQPSQYIDLAKQIR